MRSQAFARTSFVPVLAIVFASATVSVPLARVPDGRPGLITIDPPGSIDTRPVGISPQGQIVGLYITADGRRHGFLLNRDTYVPIDLSVTYTNAQSINALGQIVGRYDTPDGKMHGYLLSDGVVTTIDFPGAAGFTVVTDINPSGHMVGRYRGVDGKFHGFSLIDGNFTTIDYPGGIGIHGMAINSEGVIAGWYVDPSGRFHGFVLEGGTYTPFDPPGSIMTGTPAGALKINPAGDIVGIYRTASDVPLPCGCSGHGFIYRKGAFTTFDFPDAAVTFNTGINPRGDIVGLYIDRAGRTHGFYAPKGAEDN